MLRPTVTRQTKGLYSQLNPYAAPEGALLEAENVDIDREGVISKTRGLGKYGDLLSEGASALLDYQDRVIVHDGTSLKYDADGQGTWTAWSGTYSSPATDRRLRGHQVRKNLYFATSAGIYRQDSLTGTPLPAGVPQALQANSVTLGTTGGILGTEKQVSYRFVWVIVDANGREIYGAPSERTIVQNTSMSDSYVPDLLIDCPGELPLPADATMYCEIYRTTQTALTVDPGDRHFRAGRVPNTGGVSQISFVDTVDDAFLSKTELYSNPNVETNQQQNHQPPFAKDIATYKGHTFYANTRGRHRLQLALVDLGDLAADDTVTFTVAGVDYTLTCVTSTPSTVAQFQKVTSGSTTAENVRETAKNLVERININQVPGVLTFPFYAQYISGTNDPPGRIEVVLNSWAETPITFTANLAAAGSAFSVFDEETDTGVSVQAVEPNALYHSKLEQPDGVPPENQDLVGSEVSPILRILALRDSLIILKEEGVWKLTGEEEADFVVKEVDPSVKLLVPDSAVVLNNAVYAYTNQGVVRINEFGVAVLSRVEEHDLDRVEALPNFRALSFAVAHEHERKYYLWVPEAATDQSCRVAWVYNYFTKAWTKRRKTVQSGMVLQDSDLLFLGHGAYDYVLKERRGYALSDFVDETCPVTILGYFGDVLVVYYDGACGPVEPGWVLTYLASQVRVTAVEQETQTRWNLTVTEIPPLPGAARSSAGLDLILGVPIDGGGMVGGLSQAATLARNIPSRVRWAPELGNNPDAMKQFVWCQVSLEDVEAVRFTLGFRTDLNSTEQRVELAPLADEGWGSVWGSTPWGGDDASRTGVQTMIPLEAQRGREMSVAFEHDRGYESFDILSLGLAIREHGRAKGRQPR